MKVLRDMTDENYVFYGIAKDEAVKNSFIRWVMYAIPDKNAVAFCILPRWQQEGKNDGSTNDRHDTYFYKIIMEKGVPGDKVEDKLREIDQALVNLHFVKDPCYKDKRDLKHSPYQYAIRKLPYLRILRKSYAGVVSATDCEEWKKQAEDIMIRMKQI